MSTTTTTTTSLRANHCPDWCVNDHANDYPSHGDPGHWTVHDGSATTYLPVAAALRDAGSAVKSVWRTMSTLPDGTVVEDGILVDDLVLNRAALNILLAHVSDDEEPTGTATAPRATGPDPVEVEALTGLLDSLAGFASNGQRARYLLSSNWLRDREQTTQNVRG